MQENEGAAGYVELYNAGQFVEEEGYVGVLLALLEEKESYVRLNTAQLLTTLIQQKASTLQVRRLTAPPCARNSGSTEQSPHALCFALLLLQEYILRAQMGVSRLMDLLVDHRESVRNGSCLLARSLARLPE